MEFLEHVPLAPFTTFGIGGPARWFAEAGTESDIVDAVAFARERRLPLFVMGGGSNLLVSDQGFPGLVLHIGLRGIEQQDGLFSVAAGEDWDAFVTHAVDRNFGGIECLAGIPGTVGGTPVQNVGAYGQEVSGTIRMVRAFDRENNEFVELPPEQCQFTYRRSVFNSTQRGRYIVTRVDYRLVSGAKPEVSYQDLKRYFDKLAEPTLAQVSNAVRKIRQDKGMLLVDGDRDCASAGSFFKNPVVGAHVYARIAAQSGTPVPHFPAEGGRVKIPAAWLLEQAGFHKGFSAGRAGISSKHTLALINRGGASAEEIARLRDRILGAVEQKFGISLEPEPVWLGPESVQGIANLGSF